MSGADPLALSARIEALEHVLAEVVRDLAEHGAFLASWRRRRG